MKYSQVSQTQEIRSESAPTPMKVKPGSFYVRTPGELHPESDHAGRVKSDLRSGDPAPAAEAERFSGRDCVLRSGPEAGARHQLVAEQGRCGRVQPGDLSPGSQDDEQRDAGLAPSPPLRRRVLDAAP